MVLQGHPVKLTLVDVGHLVVLPPHRTRGRGVKNIAEPIGIVDLGDLDLLRVTVPASIILPGFSGDGALVEKVLSVFNAGVAIPALRGYLK